MCESYTDIARVYDVLTDDIDYSAWSQYYLRLLEARGYDGGQIADIACGTGNMTLALAGAGYPVLGADISPDMLMMARDKAIAAGRPELFFARMDMRDFALPKPVSAVLCANDGVNYLHAAADVRAFFRSACGALQPGGVLAFDMSTEKKLRDMDGQIYFDDREEVTLLWTNALQGDILEMDIAIFLRETDNRYARYDEKHRQRLWPTSDIETWLREEGFGDIEIYGGQTLDPPGENVDRIHFACNKIKV